MSVATPQKKWSSNSSGCSKNKSIRFTPLFWLALTILPMPELAKWMERKGWFGGLEEEKISDQLSAFELKADRELLKTALLKLQHHQYIFQRRSEHLVHDLAADKILPTKGTIAVNIAGGFGIHDGTGNPGCNFGFHR